MEYRLKVGNKCNNNCIFCSALNIKENYDKSLEEIKKELDELKEKNCIHIILPCNSDIRKDFFEILEYAKNLGFKLTLETNGRMFYYGDFARKVVEYVDKLYILYFGYDAKRHDENTSTRGSFDQARRGEHTLRNLIPSIENFYLCTKDSRLTFDKPQEVVIELTSRCNFDCVGCFNKASFAKKGRAVKEMSTEYVKEIIDSIAESKISRVRFSGGEPLLREDLFELIEYAESKNLIIWLNTNASLITRKIAIKLRKCVKNVLVPFNGYDAESDYRWTRTENSFENKLKGVELLKQNNIPVIRTGTVATPENIKNLEKIYNIVKEIDFNVWEIWRPIPLYNSEASFDISALFNKIIKLSLDWKKCIPIGNPIPFCSYDPKKMNIVSLGARFDEGHHRVVVDPRGFAKPGYFLDKNVGDPRNILRCWNHEFMRKMRNLEFTPEECKGCLYLEKCKGGSRYVAKLYNNDYKAKDPLMKSFAK